MDFLERVAVAEERDESRRSRSTTSVPSSQQTSPEADSLRRTGHAPAAEKAPAAKRRGTSPAKADGAENREEARRLRGPSTSQSEVRPQSRNVFLST